MISHRNQLDALECIQNPPATLSAEELMQIPLEWVHSEEFEQRGAQRRLFDQAEPLPQPDSAWYGPLMTPLGSKPDQTIRERASVVLTAAQERTAFRQYNYARYRFCTSRSKIKTKRPGRRQLTALRHWYECQHRLRHLIAECNLALVLAMSKRINLGDMDFGELISEGNMALMRSIDKFDVGRGFKFSTYACRAILKAFSRHGGKHLRYQKRFSVGLDPALERSHYPQERRVEDLKESAEEVRHLVLHNTAHLSDVERDVIHHRFRIGPGDAAGIRHERPRTLAQVGKLIGLTKERVRQIQNKALRKLRLSIEESSVPRKDRDDFRKRTWNLIN